MPVYVLPKSASIVEALHRDACNKLTTRGPYGQLDDPPDTEAAESALESPTGGPELEEALPLPAGSDSASGPPSPTASEVLDMIRSYIQYSQ